MFCLLYEILCVWPVSLFHSDLKNHMGLLHFIDPLLFTVFPVPIGITWLFFLYVLTKIVRV